MSKAKRQYVVGYKGFSVLYGSRPRMEEKWRNIDKTTARSALLTCRENAEQGMSMVIYRLVPVSREEVEAEVKRSK